MRSATMITIPGPIGALEAMLKEPSSAHVPIVAVICHPNPQQEGTMHNKVVSTIARAFEALGIITVRFNYRGVGKSEGEFGHVSGEVDDCNAVVDWVLERYPEHRLWLAGFSFGCYVSAKVATEHECAQLVNIAPSVENMPFTTLSVPECPWLVVQGVDDEVVSPEASFALFDTLGATVTVVKMDGVGHFFHGKLIDLRETLVDRLQAGVQA